MVVAAEQQFGRESQGKMGSGAGQSSENVRPVYSFQQRENVPPPGSANNQSQLALLPGK